MKNAAGINAFVVGDEAVNYYQRLLGLSAIGKKTSLPGLVIPGMGLFEVGRRINLHMMDSVIKSMEKEEYK